MRDKDQREEDDLERYELFCDGTKQDNLMWAEALGLLLGCVAVDPTKRARIVRKRDNLAVLALDPEGIERGHRAE